MGLTDCAIDRSICVSVVSNDGMYVPTYVPYVHIHPSCMPESVCPSFCQSHPSVGRVFDRSARMDDIEKVVYDIRIPSSLAYVSCRVPRIAREFFMMFVRPTRARMNE